MPGAHLEDHRHHQGGRALWLLAPDTVSGYVSEVKLRQGRRLTMAGYTRSEPKPNLIKYEEYALCCALRKKLTFYQLNISLRQLKFFCCRLFLYITVTIPHTVHSGRLQRKNVGSGRIANDLGKNEVRRYLKESDR